MPSLRAVRRSVPFDPRFVTRHPLSWPLTHTARTFGDAVDGPPMTSWRTIFANAPPIDFLAMTPRPRHTRGPRPPSTLYDTSIIEHGLVPSRERHWHDFANALVGGTFPRAKATLHQQQRALVMARIDPRKQRLPAHRTREQDGLAMIDEGGVLALTAPTHELWLVFDHALHEDFVLSVPSMTAHLMRLTIPTLDADPIAQTDDALAAELADPTFSTLPNELPRVYIPDTAVPPWM